MFKGAGSMFNRQTNRARRSGDAYNATFDDKTPADSWLVHYTKSVCRWQDR
jgi:hypothetical protein